MPESAAIVRRFDASDEHREFPLGTFDLVQIGGMSVGRAEYEPGWRWSTHVGAALGQEVCEVSHLGLVLSGRNRIEMTDPLGGKERVQNKEAASGINNEPEALVPLLQ